jgi:membrane protein YqaA with SNARE-associated domain
VLVRFLKNFGLWFRDLQRFIDRPWFPLALMSLTAIDLFVVIIPSDGIVLAAAMARPRRWFVTGFAMALGSVIGGVALAALTHSFGLPFVEWLSPGISSGESWVTAEAWLESLGLWLIFLIGASPLAQQPVLMLAALTNMPLTTMGLALLAGRLVKFLGYAWVGAKAPGLIRKLPFMRKEFDDVEGANDAPKGGL